MLFKTFAQSTRCLVDVMEVTSGASNAVGEVRGSECEPLSHLEALLASLDGCE